VTTELLERQLIRAAAGEPDCREILIDALYVLRRATWSRVERRQPSDPTDRRHYIRVKLARIEEEKAA
jgi:hypothetical protein